MPPTPPYDPLFELVRPDRLTTVVDVGASPIDGAPPYARMLAHGLCRVIGFEPQEDALAALVAARSERETYLPYVVGDGRPGTLSICYAPGMTSLLRPDPRMLRLQAEEVEILGRRGAVGHPDVPLGGKLQEPLVA